MTNETDKLADALHQLAKDFGSAAETYRAVQLHGLARKAESQALVIETIAAANANEKREQRVA